MASFRPVGPAAGIPPVMVSVAALVLLAALPATRAGDGFLTRTNPRTYRVQVRLTAERDDRWPDQLLLTLPVAESDAYQDVRLLGPLPGRLKRTEGTEIAYTQKRFTVSDLMGRDSVAIEYQCEVTLYDIAVNFSRFRATELYAKDLDFMRHSDRSGAYINPNHPQIVRAAARLQNEATDSLDYARRAHEYVAKGYRYRTGNPSRRFEKIMERKGGHDGDLAAIFIALLQRVGIPAWHALGTRVDNTPYSIAEFYVDGRGWVPVDVTARKFDPEGDYFGRIGDASMPLLLSRDMGLRIDGLDGEKRVSSLHRGYGFWHPNKPQPRLTFSVEFREGN